MKKSFLKKKKSLNWALSRVNIVICKLYLRKVVFKDRERWKRKLDPLELELETLGSHPT